MTSYVKCPLCGELLENQDYDNHMALRHPDVCRDWIQRPKPDIKIKNDEDGA